LKINLFSFLFVLVASGILWAQDPKPKTYFLRVAVNPVQTKQTVATAFKTKGNQVSDNPFYLTHTLTQPDTNYVLVIMTPKDGAEDTQVKGGGFALPGDVYQIWEFEPNSIPQCIVDNSKIFPVDHDWSVEVSCPVAKERKGLGG